VKLPTGDVGVPEDSYLSGEERAQGDWLACVGKVTQPGTLRAGALTSFSRRYVDERRSSNCEWRSRPTTARSTHEGSAP
jgi:hypothetical protein